MTKNSGEKWGKKGRTFDLSLQKPRGGERSSPHKKKEEYPKITL